MNSVLKKRYLFCSHIDSDDNLYVEKEDLPKFIEKVEEVTHINIDAKEIQPMDEESGNIWFDTFYNTITKGLKKQKSSMENKEETKQGWLW